MHDEQNDDGGEDIGNNDDENDNSNNLRTLPCKMSQSTYVCTYVRTYVRTYGFRGVGQTHAHGSPVHGLLYVRRYVRTPVHGKLKSKI